MKSALPPSFGLLWLNQKSVFAVIGGRVLLRINESRRCLSLFPKLDFIEFENAPDMYHPLMLG